MDLKEKIQNKKNQIQKLERLYLKYATDPEEKAIIDRFLENGDRTEYRAYLKSNNKWYGGDAWSKANELYDARQTLKKYEAQLVKENDKNNTLQEMPQVLIEFKEDLINRWDRYDEWKKQAIREEYKSQPSGAGIEYRKWQSEMREKWGRGWYDFMYKTTEQIHKSNIKDAEELVLNLINRTIEITGKITDAQYLTLDRDNSGYTIINGIIIGEKGKAKVESIGAGGYNIQRYHIRVLVKEVK